MEILIRCQYAFGARKKPVFKYPNLLPGEYRFASVQLPTHRERGMAKMPMLRLPPQLYAASLSHNSHGGNSAGRPGLRRRPASQETGCRPYRQTVGRGVSAH